MNWCSSKCCIIISQSMRELRNLVKAMNLLFHEWNDLKKTYQQHIRINFKIYKILNFGLVILLAKIYIYRWKRANIVLTNLFFLGTCDQNTFVCLHMANKQVLRICLIYVGKAADRSCRIPCLSSSHKEKQDCLKPASFLFFSFYW